MLSGDTNPIRDIGHTRWRDFYSKLENQSSPEFKSAIKTEQVHFHKQIDELTGTSKKWINMFEDVYKNGIPQSPDYAHEMYTWQNIQIRIQHGLSHTLNVWFGTTLMYTDIKQFGVHQDSKHYFVIRDIGSGGEDLQLTMYTLDDAKKYTIDHVGGNACFSFNKLVYQVAENRLRYPGIAVTDIETGKIGKLLYFDYDPRFQVELIQSPYTDTVFVKRSNALVQQLGYISADDNIVWMNDIKPDTNTGSLFPISETMYATNTTIVSIDADSKKLPKNQFTMDAFLYKSKIYISTISACVMNIYVYNPKTLVLQKLTNYKYPCTIYFHNSPNAKPRFAVHAPNEPTHIYELNTSGGEIHTLLQVYPRILELPYFEYGVVETRDHVHVPYWYVSHSEHPTRLIVSAYGAYGITAYAGYPLRWLPYLERGYALVVVAPRGGRDNGDEWYDGGRTAVRKHATFDDVADVIKFVQTKYKFKSSQTIMYGRSAGGWLATYIGLKYPLYTGSVYAEVPYLDVLRTTTNPDLPLTQLEYDEFGDPVHRPEEFKALKAISPNNIVRKAPYNSPYFLIRSALHDSQVLPYEALKFAKHLRKNGWHYCVGFDMNGGHFTKPSSLAEIQGTDAALLDHVLSAPAPAPPTAAGTRRKARTHWSKGATRRRRNSS